MQKVVAAALAAFGSALEVELEKLAEPPSASQRDKIAALLALYTSDEPPLVEGVGSAPLFEPGQLVRHRRYNYRGVVVGFDSSCQAADEWYLSNRTQPERFQPWYHVLVDGSDQITYAAQSSLLADDSDDQITHPLLPHFFSEFKNGQYTRNDTPWPE